VDDKVAKEPCMECLIYSIIVVLYDWDPLGIRLSAKKLVALRYWYGAWRRGQVANRTGHKPMTVVKVRVGRLAVGLVLPGGMK